MNLTASFIDANGNVIEKLTAEETVKIKGAKINSDGKTTTPTLQEAEILMNESRFAKVKNATSILMTASFDTNLQNDKPIWIYNSYGIDIKLGATVQIK